MDDIHIPLPDSGQHDLPIARALVIPLWLVWTFGIIAFAILTVVAICGMAWWSKRRSKRPANAP
jgi:hypothetical protein